MPTSTHDIVGKLWNLCNVLKDDGVTCHQYVTELTYLLFLKMAKETGQEQGIPSEYRWDVLEMLQGLSQPEHYKELLLKLGSSSSGASALVQEIYANASSFIKKPTTLNKLVLARSVSGQSRNHPYRNSRAPATGTHEPGVMKKLHQNDERYLGGRQWHLPKAASSVCRQICKPEILAQRGTSPATQRLSGTGAVA